MRYAGIIERPAVPLQGRGSALAPRGKASWKLAASVHQADIDHDAWSSRRGGPARVPDLYASGCSVLVAVTFPDQVVL
jgi:hypothetical protein